MRTEWKLSNRIFHKKTSDENEAAYVSVGEVDMPDRDPVILSAEYYSAKSACICVEVTQVQH